MKFNINGFVRVKLTDHGREIHRKWHEDLFEGYDKSRYYAFEPEKEDADGWSKWQLWELMQVFGPGTGMGMPQSPFDMVIEIDENQECVIRED